MGKDTKFRDVFDSISPNTEFAAEKARKVAANWAKKLGIEIKI